MREGHKCGTKGRTIHLVDDSTFESSDRVRGHVGGRSAEVANGAGNSRDSVVDQDEGVLV